MPIKNDSSIRVPRRRKVVRSSERRRRATLELELEEEGRAESGKHRFGIEMTETCRAIQWSVRSLGTELGERAEEEGKEKKGTPPAIREALPH
jgi:hypothetical protein